MLPFSTGRANVALRAEAAVSGLPQRHAVSPSAL